MVRVPLSRRRRLVTIPDTQDCQYQSPVFFGYTLARNSLANANAQERDKRPTREDFISYRPGQSCPVCLVGKPGTSDLREGKQAGCESAEHAVPRRALTHPSKVDVGGRSSVRETRYTRDLFLPVLSVSNICGDVVMWRCSDVETKHRRRRRNYLRVHLGVSRWSRTVGGRIHIASRARLCGRKDLSSRCLSGFSL